MVVKKEMELLSSLQVFAPHQAFNDDIPPDDRALVPRFSHDEYLMNRATICLLVDSLCDNVVFVPRFFTPTTSSEVAWYIWCMALSGSASCHRPRAAGLLRTSGPALLRDHALDPFSAASWILKQQQSRYATSSRGFQLASS